MHSAAIAAIILWPAFALAQAPDVAPLLPAPTTSTQAIRAAVLSGDVGRAAALAEALDPPQRTLWRGILAIMRNDPTTAIRTLRRGDHPKALGVAYYLARQYLLFRDQMAEAIRREPADFGPYYYLGRHYDSDLDNNDEAVRCFRLALDRNPAYTRARAYLGTCLERQGLVQEAEKAFQASLPIPVAQLGLARLRMAAGDLKTALVWTEKARAADPLDAGAHKLAARIYGAMERPRDAAAALELAAKEIGRAHV